MSSRCRTGGCQPEPASPAQRALQKAAQDGAEAAMEALVDALHSDNAAVSLRAALALLEIAHGPIPEWLVLRPRPFDELPPPEQLKLMRRAVAELEKQAAAQELAQAPAAGGNDSEQP